MSKRPNFLEGPIRNWKSRKRSEFDAVLRAFGKFREGCAYVPGYNDHHKVLMQHLEEWRETMNIKSWGR